ncbi:MAG: nucleotidyltransferase domain-containing protein [Anaerolineales bacterium]|jgi:predicted nucleotidyltransferase
MELKSLELPVEEIRLFCERWKIVEFAIFGSAIRADYGPESDLDVLIEFSSDAKWGLFDHVDMKIELQGILGRDIDLVTRSALEQSHNWVRKAEILSTAQVLDLQGET